MEEWINAKEHPPETEDVMLCVVSGTVPGEFEIIMDNAIEFAKYSPMWGWQLVDYPYYLCTDADVSYYIPIPKLPEGLTHAYG